MSKGKKHLLTIVISFLVLGGLIAAYMWIPQSEKEAEEEKAKSFEVVAIDTEQITELNATCEGKEDLSLKKEKDEWKLTDIPEATLNAEEVEKVLKAFTKVEANKELEKGDNLSEYGLDQPTMKIEVKTSKGDDFLFELGAKVPVSGGNYGLLGESKKIYAFTSDLYQAFDIKKTSLIQMEEIADFGTDYLTSIQVKTEGKKTFEAKVVSEKEQVDAYTDWNITAPLKKPLAGSNTDSWKTMQGFFSSISFESMEEYQCKDFSKYGLDKSKDTVEVHFFTVDPNYDGSENRSSERKTSAATTIVSQKNIIPEKYRRNQKYTLTVGKKTKDGNYYVRLNDSKNVYVLAATATENMMGVSPYSYMDSCVYATMAADIDGYDVSFGKKKLSVTHDTKKDGDEEKDIWTLNGQSVPEDGVEKLLLPYSKAFLLEYTSQAKEDVKPASKKPVLKIVYHEPIRDVTVIYYPYDGTNFYRVDKDGMNYFLVDKKSVDAVVAAFDSLLDQ